MPARFMHGRGRNRPPMALMLCACVAGLFLSLIAAGTASAAFPGTNGKIAFFSSRDAPDPFDIPNSDIYTMEPDGSGVSRVTTTPNGRQAADPAWSANGQRLVLASSKEGVVDQHGNASLDIYVVEADGSGLTRLTSEADTERFPTWSPDGTRIAYTRCCSLGNQVWVMNADGTGQTFLSGGENPSWSPDGSKIAVEAGNGISTFNVDGTGGAQVTFGGGGDDVEPDWSPDGQKIVFRREINGGGSRIYVTNADGSGLTALTPAGGGVVNPVWSPDGEKIAFARNDADGTEIYVMDADGGQPTRLTNNPTYVTDIQPTWQPLPGQGPSDTDGDGVEDSVDPDPSTASNGFADGDGNTGSITDRAGLDVTVEDAAAPDGVRITVGAGSGRVTVSVCGGFTLRVSAGSEIVVTCGSVKVQVLEGAAEVVLGGGLTAVSVPQGVTAKVSANPNGSFKIENLGGGNVTVTVDGVQTTIGPGATKSVTVWDFHGFSAPVDNPVAINGVNAGQSVPLKWRLVRADGTPVTTLTTARLTVSTLACAVGTTPDRLEEVAPGASGLKNLGNGYYQINWKTPTSYARSCKTLHLDLGEGITRDAYFKFTK